MAEYQLAQGIIGLSVARVWDIAKLEWELRDVFESEEPGNCLCGHYPIIEHCVLGNKFNSNVAIVGNCCVKKFMGLPSDLIFQATKRVRADLGKSLNADAIEYARSRQWINAWEQDFYARIMRKRILTERQVEKKLQINRKFLIQMQRAGANWTLRQSG